MWGSADLLGHLVGTEVLILEEVEHVQLYGRPQYRRVPESAGKLIDLLWVIRIGSGLTHHSPSPKEFLLSRPQVKTKDQGNTG